MPPGDILIHSGDITKIGELDTIKDFCDWVKDLHYPHAICVYGNHELGHDKPGPKKQKGIELLQEAGIIYLEDSGIEIDGLKVWGSPYTPFYKDWAFNRNSIEIKRHWDAIPDDTNILITHGPPYSILDDLERFDFHRGSYIENVGCKSLLARIKELKQLKLHCYGHIHECYGKIEIDGIKFVNSSICQALPKQGPNEPQIIDI
jgi:Icc-related predicted phosphoesterase